MGNGGSITASVCVSTENSGTHKTHPGLENDHRVLPEIGTEITMILFPRGRGIVQDVHVRKQIIQRRVNA